MGRKTRVRIHGRDCGRGVSKLADSEGEDSMKSLELAVANFLINLEAKGFIRINREVLRAEAIQK